MAPKPKNFYSQDPKWADVIPQVEEGRGTAGGGGILAQIAYTDDYREAISYLRAVMAACEVSERVLKLTEDVIDMNPAHYTAWIYRAKVVKQLQSQLQSWKQTPTPTPTPPQPPDQQLLRREIQWLNQIAMRHLKNYQVWAHRQTIVDTLDSAQGEQAFLNSILRLDAKNYHVWSYRQWLVRRFGLWDSNNTHHPPLPHHDQGAGAHFDSIGSSGSGPSCCLPPPPVDEPQVPTELQAVHELIQQDVRNNSAWNHRWFLVFGRDSEAAEAAKVGPGHQLHQPHHQQLIKRELDYVASQISRAPQNQCPWLYLRGIMDRMMKTEEEHHPGQEPPIPPPHQPQQVRRPQKQPPLEQEQEQEKEHRDALREQREFITGLAEAYGSIDRPDEVRSCHALELRADIYAAARDYASCRRAYSLLASRFDLIRHRYWSWKADQLLGLGREEMV